MLKHSSGGGALYNLSNTGSDEDEYLEKLARILFDKVEKEFQEEDTLNSSKT